MIAEAMIVEAVYQCEIPSESRTRDELRLVGTEARTLFVVLARDDTG